MPSLEELILKLKLQHFGHLVWTSSSLEKSWMLGRLKARGEADDRRWDDWTASPTKWAWVWANSRRWWRTGKPDMVQFMESQRVGYDWVSEQYLRYFSEFFSCRYALLQKTGTFVNKSSVSLLMPVEHRL